MKNVQKILLSLTLVAGASAPASAFSLIHHRQPATVQTQGTTTVTPARHKNFVQRHPVISAIGAAVVVHQIAKHRH